MDIWENWLHGSPIAGADEAIGGIAQWAFFKLIFEFLDAEIITFRDNMVGQAFVWIGGVALLMLTVWILLQGYRIATGQSRDSMMVLVTNSLRSLLIVSVATSLAFRTTDVYGMLSYGVQNEITMVVTGDDDSPAETIDKSLDKMQFAMIGIDALAGNDPGNKDDKDRALWLTGLGVAGPSVVGGAMLLLYKIALALFVGLGPLFILSLLFEQTKQLFSRWLYYGIGTMFSLSVMSFMVAVAMKMTFAVAAAFAAQYVIALGTGAPTGITSMALQQGGLGLILSVLLVMTPPMAAQFFQGTMGAFNSYSSFGGIGARSDPMGRPAAHLGGGGFAGRPGMAGPGSEVGARGEPDTRLAYGMPSSAYQPGTDEVKRTRRDAVA